MIPRPRHETAHRPDVSASGGQPATISSSASPWVRGPARATRNEWSAPVIGCHLGPVTAELRPTPRPRSRRRPASPARRDGDGRSSARPPGNARDAPVDGAGTRGDRTPAAPSGAAVRQATRAPALLPPTTRGASGTCARTAGRASLQAASSWRGGPATDRPASRHGCSNLATVTPTSGSHRASTCRSRRLDASTGTVPEREQRAHPARCCVQVPPGGTDRRADGHELRHGDRLTSREATPRHRPPSRAPPRPAGAAR